MSAILHYNPDKGPLMAQLKVDGIEGIYPSPYFQGYFTRYKRIRIGDKIYQIQKKIEFMKKRMKKPVYILTCWDRETEGKDKLIESNISEKQLQNLALTYVGRKPIDSTASSIESKTRPYPSLASKRP